MFLIRGFSSFSESSVSRDLKETELTLTPFSDANSNIPDTVSSLFFELSRDCNLCLKSCSNVMTSEIFIFSKVESYMINPFSRTSSACLNIVSASNAISMLVPFMLELIFSSDILTAK